MEIMPSFSGLQKPGIPGHIHHIGEPCRLYRYQFSYENAKKGKSPRMEITLLQL